MGLRTSYNDRPLGYQQFTPAASQLLPSVPAGTIFAIITTETQAVRWRDDGTAPTAGVGYPLAIGDELRYTGDFTSFRLIQAAVGAVVSVCYYSGPLV